MSLEGGNEVVVPPTHNAFISTHTCNIDAGSAWAGWLESLFVERKPTLVGEFNPFVGNKDVFSHLRKHAEHFYAKEVIRAVQSILEDEIAFTFVKILLIHWRGPALNLVLHPLVVHLTGNDDLLLHDVFCVQRIEAELGESFGLHGASGITSRHVWVEYNQQSRVSLQVTLNGCECRFGYTRSLRNDKHGIHGMETRPSLGRVVSSFETREEPLFIVCTNIECDQSARKELRSLE